MASLVNIAVPDFLPTLLIADDEVPVRDYLLEALLPCCAKVRAVGNILDALQALETERFDLVLADVCMPGGGGLDLLALIQQLKWDCAVILMTGHAQLEHVVASVRLQASDFLLKPFSLSMLHEAVRQCYGKLSARRLREGDRNELNANLLRQERQLDLSRHLLSDTQRSALESLILTLEARERNTYAHSFRVRAYALHLASQIGYPTPGLELLGHAALLHDIGKVAVSDQVLLKPGPLTCQEYETLKSHSAVGERIVNRMGFLAGAGAIIRHHHERWDSRGYPDGISGPNIPLGSRLFAVADTLDAMTSSRCYRRALSFQAAREEIARCAGSQFDPDIAAAFAKVPETTWHSLRDLADGDALAASTPTSLPQGSPLLIEAPLQSFPVTDRL